MIIVLITTGVRIMKRILALVLIIALLFSFFAACSGTQTVSPEGESFIHAKGKELYINGEKIVLKGVNAGGWLLTEDWLTPTSLDGELSSEHGQYELEKALASKHGSEKTKELFETYRDNWWREEDFKNVASIGFNLIRLPFGWKDVADENGNVKKDGFTRLDWFVNECEKNNLFVILDLHASYGSQNGRHHSGDTSSGGALFGNPENERKTAKLWKAVAEHFKGNTTVAGFDLLNEPEGQPGGLTEKSQWDYYDRLYKEIRSADKNHLLLLESCWDVNHMPNPKDYGWENVAYEYHYYNWDNGNDLKSMKSFFSYKARMEFKYNSLKYRVPVFIGEFTFFDNPECWRYGLEFFEKHSMSFAMWTYKGQVQSNWVLYQGEKRTAENIVTPQTDYERAKEIFENTKTDKFFKENTELINIIKEYL